MKQTYGTYSLQIDACSPPEPCHNRWKKLIIEWRSNITIIKDCIKLCSTTICCLMACRWTCYEILYVVVCFCPFQQIWQMEKKCKRHYLLKMILHWKKKSKFVQYHPPQNCVLDGLMDGWTDGQMMSNAIIGDQLISTKATDNIVSS